MPDSGRIDLFEKPFDRKSLDRVGYLPEERGLYKKMKVLDQLVFFGRAARHRARKTRASAPGDWASRMEISDSLERRRRSFPRACSRRFNSSPRCCTIPAWW